MKIKISADSTCDLSPELIERYHIGITPLYIIRGEETLRDGIDVRPEELYEYANATGKLCKTAAVNVSDYLAYFAACREEYDAVIHFTISSDMSACYQNACIAAQEFTNVYPVDSRNLSTGIGHLVLDAAEMAEQGMDAADIASVHRGQGRQDGRRPQVPRQARKVLRAVHRGAAQGPRRHRLPSHLHHGLRLR